MHTQEVPVVAGDVAGGVAGDVAGADSSLYRDLQSLMDRTVILFQIRAYWELLPEKFFCLKKTKINKL